MSSTSAESLSRAIFSRDNVAVVNIIERRIIDDTATEGERLLCGVMLLMPPLADYEAASNIFSNMLNGPRRLEAAIWDAYRFAVLMPDEPRSFMPVLRSSPQSAVAAHMMSKVALMSDDAKLALNENRRSRSLRLFPFNIFEGLRIDSVIGANERDNLWRTACDLIFDKSAESDSRISTTEGALQKRWDNLIIGTRLTSQLWHEYEKQFMK